MHHSSTHHTHTNTVYIQCILMHISIHTYYTHIRVLDNVPTEEKYGHEVVVIPVDFSDGMEIYPNIAEQLNDLDIGVLSMQLAKIYHSA